MLVQFIVTAAFITAAIFAVQVTIPVRNGKPI
jgi:hypothetical protein